MGMWDPVGIYIDGTAVATWDLSIFLGFFFFFNYQLFFNFSPIITCPNLIFYFFELLVTDQGLRIEAATCDFERISETK